MTRRDSRGPIRRRARDRKAPDTSRTDDRDRRDGAAEQDASATPPSATDAPGRSRGSQGEHAPRHRDEGPRGASRGRGGFSGGSTRVARLRTPGPTSGGGRRVFDPRGSDTGPAPHTALRRRAVDVPKRGGAADKRGGRGRAPEASPPALDPAESEKAQQRAAAQELATEKGIPVVHALRVVRGQASLNDVLKALMHKERIERLVTKDGIDRGLAGQVAAGQLPKERALLITKIRRYRTHRLDRDALKVAELDREPVAVALFGRGWVVGLVKAARTYEFDLRPQDGGAVETLLKHDVKAVADPEAVASIDAQAEVEDVVRSESLKGTAVRTERVTTSDETLLALLESGEPKRFVLRDGQVFVGKLRAFGRWDCEVELADGAVVQLLFHGLHIATDFLGPGPSES